MAKQEELISKMVHPSCFQELDDLKKSLNEVIALQKKVSVNDNYFSRIAFKIATTKKDFQLTGIGLNPTEGLLLDIISQKLMPKSEYNKFKVRIAARVI